MKNLWYFLVISLMACNNNLPENAGKVDAVLYAGKGDHQPLIVGLGGSEGGNAWTSDRWAKTRNQFLDSGYAFLALGYFAVPGTPEKLDRISIEAIHNAILIAARNEKIDSTHIAVIGGSKGAELALLLASHFPDIKCVVALVGSHSTFPALTWTASTSSWTYHGEEVPYVPMPWAAVPSAIKGDLRSAFQIMIEDTVAVAKALIQVENINGPILLVSATKDEMWPSKEMSDQIMKTLDAKNFSFPHEHIMVEGGHTDVLDHFNDIISFLAKNFPSKKLKGRKH